MDGQGPSLSTAVKLGVWLDHQFITSFTIDHAKPWLHHNSSPSEQKIATLGLRYATCIAWFQRMATSFYNLSHRIEQFWQHFPLDQCYIYTSLARSLITHAYRTSPIRWRLWVHIQCGRKQAYPRLLSLGREAIGRNTVLTAGQGVVLLGTGDARCYTTATFCKLQPQLLGLRRISVAQRWRPWSGDSQIKLLYMSKLSALHYWLSTR